MSVPTPTARRASVASTIQQVGRAVALTGVVLPLLLIGGLKFTQFEVEALKPLIGGAPWLAWMYPAFGEAGTSYVLGVVEITTALLLVASFRFPRAGHFHRRFKGAFGFTPGRGARCTWIQDVLPSPRTL